MAYMPKSAKQINTGYMPKSAVPVQKTAEGFVSNLPKNAWNTAKGVVEFAVNANPVFQPDISKNSIVNLVTHPKEIISSYSERYGIGDALKGDFQTAGKKIGNTAYYDPIGTAMDVSMVYGGVKAAPKVVSGISKAGKGAEASTFIKRLPPKGPDGGGFIAKTGERIENWGKDYGVRSTRISQSGQNLFKNKTGMELPEYLSKTKLYGQDVGKVEEFIEPLQEAFDKATIGSKQTVKLSKIVRKFDDVIEGIRNGPKNIDPVSRKLADFLENERDVLIANSDGFEVPLKTLTEIRRAIDENTPMKQFMPFEHGQQSTLGGIYRDVLNETAGTKALGKELNKAYTFKKVLEKAPKGKGNLPLGLNKTVSAAAGAAALNKIPLVGPLAGMAVEAVVNNPAVSGKVAETAQSIGRFVKGLEPKTVSRIPVKKLSVVKGAKIKPVLKLEAKPKTFQKIKAPAWMDERGSANLFAEVFPKDKGEVLYHSSSDVFKGGKPDFDAYFGNKNWRKSFAKEFGDKEYEIVLPKETKILDLDKNTPEAESFIKKWGGSRDDFYSEDWTDKAKVMPEIKKLGYDGAKFGDEYLLTKEAISRAETNNSIKRVTNLDPVSEVSTKDNIKSMVSGMRDKVGTKANTFVDTRPSIEKTIDNVKANDLDVLPKVGEVVDGKTVMDVWFNYDGKPFVYVQDNVTKKLRSMPLVDFLKGGK